ncbi:MAG: branched-chain amino acid ABC transporter permease [Acidobacteria bacterium]|nr:branched-chain amino acid ABC transporter permease [Acidobacteriota bacterium]
MRARIAERVPAGETSVAARPQISEGVPVPGGRAPAGARLRRAAPPVAALAAAAILPPLLLDGVWNFTFTLALIMGLEGLSIVLVTGFVGQLSLMPATFVGVGAFASAALATRLDTPFWGAVPLAAMLTVPVALVIGAVSLRLKGLYLAIMTLVFADVGQEFLFKQQWFSGHGNTTDAPRPALAGIDFASDKSYYVLVLLIVAAFIFGVWNLSRSRTARACFAVRDNESAAQAMGVNIAKYKLLAFALHGFIAGFAGALFAHWQQSVSAGGQRPTFGLEASLTIVFLTILGGVRSIWGPFAGAAIWVILVQRLLAGSPNGQSIAFSVFGLLVLLTMMYRPAGLVGWLGDAARALRRRAGRVA